MTEAAGLLEIKVPDIGDFDVVDVIEVLVSVGDEVEGDDSLITLESDKASMEIPSPEAGRIESIEVAVGDQVGEGALIATLKPAKAQGSGESESVTDEPANSGEEPLAQDTADGSEASDEPSAAGGLPAESATHTPGDVDYDLVVLGSGPGGYAAAFRAADLGLRTALVEKHSMLGGVCLNVGCIPSKALLHAAKVIDEARAFADHGVRFGEPEIDLDALRSWKDGVVARLTGGLDQLAKRRKVEVIRGTGRLADAHTLTVEGDEERSVRFAKLVIAVGSRSVEIPGVPHDSTLVWDSTDALELRSVPERLLVVGGGIIGLEMATVYAALGSKVSVVELLPTLMTGVDRDLVRPLEKRIRAQYENIWTSTKLLGIVEDGGRLVASFEGKYAPETAGFDAALIAVGRRPNGDLIDAEQAGLEPTERGFLEVDDRQRTNVPHIFAIGDVVGQPMLAHKATHEGHVAAEVAAGLKSGFDARVIPGVAYTDPEVAWVGLTETEAKEKGLAVEKGVFPWAASGRSLALGRDEGSTKLLFDPETHRVVGGGAVGPNAGDVIAEIGHAIEMGSDAQDLALTVHAHPTLSETVGLAAEVFEGTVTDLYAPKKKR